jgi:thymidylate kinase
MDTKLIIVEGLTGCGKSIMAHFIARQLQYYGARAYWVHEAESPHPISIDVGAGIEPYMEEMQVRWAAFVDKTESSGEVVVVEACFFNNLIETLLAHDVDRRRIVSYGYDLQKIIAPLKPALVYLTQRDVVQALDRNFLNRGEGF